MKSNIKKFIFSIVFFCLGCFWMKFRLPPINYISSIINNEIDSPENQLTPDSIMPSFEPVKLISMYSAKTPLYSDRKYFNEINNNYFKGAYVVQIPRHDTTSTKLNCLDSLTVFRIVDNKFKLKNDWKKLDIKVKVVGYTSILDKLVSKDFGPGLIDLKCNHPTNYPIIIKTKENTSCGFELY